MSLAFYLVFSWPVKTWAWLLGGASSTQSSLWTVLLESVKGEKKNIQELLQTLTISFFNHIQGDLYHYLWHDNDVMSQWGISFDPDMYEEIRPTHYKELDYSAFIRTHDIVTEFGIGRTCLTWEKSLTSSPLHLLGIAGLLRSWLTTFFTSSKLGSVAKQS